MQINVERMQAVGLGGTAILLIGCFSPLFHLPIVGSMSFIGNGDGDGIFVIALAVIAAVLLFIRAYAWVLGPASGAAIISAITFFRVVSGMSNMRSQLAGDMKDNPFAGLASAFVQNISLEWGWALLLIGLLCLFVAASMDFFTNEAQAAVPTLRPTKQTPPFTMAATPPQPDVFAGQRNAKRSSFGQR